MAFRSDADLTFVIDEWAHLSPAIRAGILAMVKAARDHNRDLNESEQPR